MANVTADYVSSRAQIKELLIKRVTGSVLWEESIQRMIADGITNYIEVGPGKVLAGLIGKINKDAVIKSFQEV